ncbi:MAG TPA: DNA polymerase III subunit beta [Leptospiraceae bacterium]|nr:DNA polymerase III subunit beta [Leptospiraceae bacterium]
MLIEINAKTLSKALHIASAIAAKKTGNMATSNILLEATKNELKIKATNLQVSFCASLECSVSKTGSVLIGAEKFSGIVQTYNDDIVLKSTARGLSMLCGEDKYNFSGFPVENFPKLEAEGRTPFKIETKIFAGMLKRTAFLVEELEDKPMVSGINLVTDKNVFKLTSTDTLRIAVTSYATKTDFLVNSNATLPKTALGQLIALLPEDEFMEFGTDESKYYFKCGNLAFSSTVQAQKYPDVSRMFIDGDSILIDRKALEKALKRAKLLADKVALTNEFVFTDNQLCIKIDDEEGSSDQIVPVENGTNFSVIFKITQLLDFLKSIESEKIEFIHDKDKRRFTLKETDSLFETKYLIQPIVSK